jgi:peroxiredoxin Q/BCP
MHHSPRMISVGSPAPPFAGTDHTGRAISLEELRQKGPVVLYFYPRDFTPGCTREACMFRDGHAELELLSATVVGVSIDDDASHRRFAAEHRLPYSLLSDPGHALAERYGIARRFGLGAQRVTFVIDRAGVVRAAIHSELSMSRHVAETKKALAQLT